MDRINRNNYEAFFLDYHEGRLNSAEEQMIMAFLQEHPEFYDAFEDYNGVVIPVPDIRYPDKSELFRTEISLPDSNEWEYKCIAFMEGDLTDDDLSDFERQRLSDPEKAKVLELYLATRLIPEESLQFHDKQALKKKVVLIPRWIYGAVSAAAILVLAWIIFTPRSGIIDNQLIADDSSRQVINIDKISHPDKYEKISSTEQQKPAMLKSSLAKAVVPEGNPESIGTDDEEMVRDNFTMASLATRRPGRVESNFEVTYPTSSLFVYRFIPGVEDDDYITLVAFSGEFIREQLLGQDPELVKKSRFSLWELADAGLEKISSVFGIGADIEREYNQSGELVAVSFESSLVGFNTPVKRKQNAQAD